MKSLLSPLANPIVNSFSEQILEWLKKEGFEESKNDSYFFSESGIEWENNCFKKTIYGSFTINIYIFSSAIGVEIDYDCGGNCDTRLWEFSKHSFERAYDKMVDYVNSYK